MIEAGNGGAICSMSSLTAHDPGIGLIAYGSSKAGLEHATRIAAVELGPHGIRVNCVSAHLIETPMTQQIFRNRVAIAAMEECTPLRRMGTPEDIANATYYLCSDEGAYVSGQTLCVDGGASLLNLPTPQQRADVAARRTDLREEPAAPPA
jgi:NAD(P)-dependent dehydrogenase (short-subunit alcohol dehydrogenase family)